MNISIPQNYKDAEFKNIQQEIQNLFRKFYVDKEKSGLYIHGPVGCGKTHVLYAIRKAVKFPEYKKYPDYDFDNVLKMFNVLRDLSIEERKFNEYEKAITLEKFISHPKLLLLDDFGSDDPKDLKLSAKSVMLNLVDYRYEHKLPTIFSSNFSLHEIAERYDSRIASRIKGMCHVIELKGEDKR